MSSETSNNVVSVYSYSLPDEQVKVTVGVTLSKAVRDWTPYLEGATALVYSPRTCGFGRLAKEGVLEFPEGSSFLTDKIFEARIFDEKYEIRWLRNPEAKDGSGKAVVMMENLETKWPDGWINDSNASFEYLESRDDSYLLWGGLAEEDNGWSILKDHRVGRIWVPYIDPGTGSKKKTYLRLKVREYLAEDDPANGNVAVVAERLLGFDIDSYRG